MASSQQLPCSQHITQWQPETWPANFRLMTRDPWWTIIFYYIAPPPHTLLLEMTSDNFQKSKVCGRQWVSSFFKKYLFARLPEANDFLVGQKTFYSTPLAILSKSDLGPAILFPVFTLRFSLCWSDTNFKHDKEGELAGLTLILPAEGRGPALEANFYHWS